MKSQFTEEKILDAATEVFQIKGMDGARMQEIAEKASINKAMLHYYYRGKEKLFQAVFKRTIQMIIPKMIKIISSEEPLFDKIRKFTDNYVSFIMEHPYIPLFIINELEKHPDIIDTVIKTNVDGEIRKKLTRQIDDLVKKGEIRPINPEQLFLNMLSMSIFPIMAQTSLRTILQKNKEQYKQLLEERKTFIADFIIAAIKK
jgi:AcrR family transcriptional regulator